MPEFNSPRLGQGKGEEREFIILGPAGLQESNSSFTSTLLSS